MYLQYYMGTSVYYTCDYHTTKVEIENTYFVNRPL